MQSPNAHVLAPVLGLLFNAMVWGLSWWPMRQLQSAGLHPLWSTALIFLLITLSISVSRPQAWRLLLTQPPLWLILLASGVTNAAFNWGVVAGDVVRVILLFYLMPLWTVFLAWLLLNERPSAWAVARVVLALAGSVVVMWPQDGRSLGAWSLVDGLGLLGGLSFSFSNVLMRREAHRPESARALAMFVGGVVVSTALALGLDAPPPPLSSVLNWLPGVVGMGLCFLACNLCFQYGASRLPANVTAVVMLTEVVWASGSAMLMGAGQITPALALGGSLIVAAAALAAWRP